MKFTIIMLILATIFSVARSEDQEIDMNVYQKIRQIENHKFGKTLIDTIAVQMNVGDPANDLIQLLQDIEDNIRAEQDEDDKYILKLQEECDKQLAGLQADIEIAKERVAQLEALLEELIPIRDQKVLTLGNKNDFRALIEQKLVDIDERKALKDQEWSTEQEQHDHASSVIQKAKEIIEGELKSFLQKGSSAFAQVTTSIRSSLKSYNYSRKSWSSFFSILATVTDDLGPQADQDSVSRIIQLCEDILDKIAESREIERKDYQHWVQEYNQTKSGLNDKLDEVKTQIQNLEQQIATLNKRIQDAQLESQEQTKRAEDKEKMHDERLQYCEDENKGYAERREQRDDERSIVSQTIGLLQANLRTFRKYIRDRQE